MADSIQCNICDKPATVHLTQIVNGKVHKIDLCEACAKEKGVTDPNGFSLADLLAGNVEGTVMGDAPHMMVCENCGFTPDDYKKLGRLGCSSCYDSLHAMIKPMLAHMHKGVTHIGKIPRNTLDRAAIKRQIDQLQSQMMDAIRDERYEDAAEMRDEIKNIEEKEKSANVH